MMLRVGPPLELVKEDMPNHAGLGRDINADWIDVGETLLHGHIQSGDTVHPVGYQRVYG